jgi:SAM-dependent methyltransferase
MWQTSWDRLEEALVPDRELRIRTLIDVVEAAGRTSPTVMDLACGTGTLTDRLLERMPAARSIAVDIDPVLLAIASATFADDDRVRIVRADLRDPGWATVVPERHIDVVLTATALHWLPAAAVRRLYHDLAALVRPGGVVAHAEEMPLAELPRLGAALGEVDRARRAGGQIDGLSSWDAWWEKVAADPLLRDALSERGTVFEASYPVEEFSPPANWHVAALREAGFAEAGVVWRSGPGAIVAAVR